MIQSILNLDNPHDPKPTSVAFRQNPINPNNPEFRQPKSPSAQIGCFPAGVISRKTLNPNLLLSGGRDGGDGQGGGGDQG